MELGALLAPYQHPPFVSNCSTPLTFRFGLPSKCAIVTMMWTFRMDDDYHVSGPSTAAVVGRLEDYLNTPELLSEEQ